jgi:predicted Zn-dependent protease
MRCAETTKGVFESEITESKWDKKELTYSIKTGTNDFNRLRTALNLAMTNWDIEIPIKLKYVKTGGDITIEFSTNDQYFSQMPGVLAYAYFPGSGNMSGKIVFNDNYLWSMKGEAITGEEYMRITGRKVSDPSNFFATYNILHTLTHEIGHSLGLAHSNFKEDVMYPFYNGVMELSDNDTKRIQTKYGMGTNTKRLREWFKHRIGR